MSRAPDHTLLAKLGFSDADRKELKHNLIPHFLHAKKLENLVKLCRPKPHMLEDKYSIGKRYFYDEKTDRPYTIEKFNELIDIKCEKLTEHPISKGQHQYKQTIGFIDAVFIIKRTWKINYKFKPKEDNPDLMDSVIMVRDWSEEPWRIYIEAKVCQINAADIIRQINLYREHMYYEGEDGYSSNPFTPSSPTPFVLATPASFSLSAMEAEDLQKNNILWVVCGDDFEEWFKEQRCTLVSGTKI
jgi:hypothetical protein